MGYTKDDLTERGRRGASSTLGDELGSLNCHGYPTVLNVVQT